CGPCGGRVIAASRNDPQGRGYKLFWLLAEFRLFLFERLLELSAYLQFALGGTQAIEGGSYVVRAVELLRLFFPISVHAVISKIFLRQRFVVVHPRETARGFTGRKFLQQNSRVGEITLLPVFDRE